MNITTTLRKNPLFRNIDPNALQSLIKECHVKKLEKGHELFSMGEHAHSLYIIMDGWIKLFRVSRSGEEAVIHIFGPGESFAEAAVFSENQIYPVNAQAIEESEVLGIPRSFFVNKIKEDSNFALTMLGTIAARQNFLVHHMEQLTTRSASQRIGYFLLRFCQESHDKNGQMVVTLPYDKSIISTRLNIKPETFSRSLSTLREHGIITNGRQVTITSIDKLTEYCDLQKSEKLC
ncbi:MAG: Crp/Fnr family transcriptional regulator [Pseudobdellovibrionaceae bacterium]